MDAAEERIRARVDAETAGWNARDARALAHCNAGESKYQSSGGKSMRAAFSARRTSLIEIMPTRSFPSTTGR